MIKVATALVSTFVGLVLLLSFKSHSAGAPKPALALGPDSGSGSGSVSATSTSAPPTTDSGSPAPRTSATRSKAATPTAASGVFTGSPIDTRYGTMQVAAVVRSGKLVDIRVLQETDGGRSHEIDAASIPLLKSEALSAQSARINVVSGATYTSEGYAQSLQSALDQAHL